VDVPDRLIGVAGDGHQKVVEVVRDSAGELADRLHLLRLPELLLERLPLADVAMGDHDSRNPRIVGEVRQMPFEAARLASGRPGAELGRAGPSGSAGDLRQLCAKALRLLRDDVRHEIRAEAPLDVVAEHALDGVALVDDRAFSVDDGDDVVRVLHERAEPALALAQGIPLHRGNGGATPRALVEMDEEGQAERRDDDDEHGGQIGVATHALRARPERCALLVDQLDERLEDGIRSRGGSTHRHRCVVRQAAGDAGHPGVE
jgi:hypothetical protein